MGLFQTGGCLENSLITGDEQMKLIHCADIHLDSRMEANLTKEQAKLRKNELLLTFCDLVEYAATHDVKAVMIAGDLFDTGRVAVRTRNVVMELMTGHPQIDFYYIRGNHDQTWLTAEQEGLPDNLYLFDEEWKSYTYSGEAITISGVELSADNHLRVCNTLVLDPDRVNIVMMHGQEAHYHGKDQAEIINLRELRDKSIDYLALGHLHSYKAEPLDKRGICCYSGCLEGRGFDECGEKGFVLLDVKDGRIESQFIPFARRTLFEVPVDLSGLQTAGEIEAVVAEQLSKIGKENLVKVLLQGSVEVDTPKDVDYLLSRFAGDYFFLKIYDQTKLDIHIEDYQNDVSLKGEFIRMVLSEKLPQERKTQIILNGIRALSGEEID
ncbi:MAG: metallophosphoesterase, partial [bacterium]|nr:metallophosphoesterase [bacterium]